MKEQLENETESPVENLMEATHFGLRRLHEGQKGAGHQWPLVFTAILIKTNADWKFHTLHWSMPVD